MMQASVSTRSAGYFLALVAGSGVSGIVQAQSTESGSYTGTLKISATEIDPQTSYEASIKISLPVTQRDDSAVTAEFYSGEAPDAIATITRWDMSHTESSADSDGQFTSWKCKLAGPAEVRMTPTGVLNVDLEAGTHAMSITLLSLEDVELSCINSRSGPYTDSRGLMLYAGTGLPGMHYQTQLPFADAAHLTAKYTLMPTEDTQGQYGPIIQEWDLKLAP